MRAFTIFRKVVRVRVRVRVMNRARVMGRVRVRRKYFLTSASTSYTTTVIVWEHYGNYKGWLGSGGGAL